MNDKDIEKWCDENPKTVEKYCAWLNYESGFSGKGTTALDQKPNFEKPENIPLEVKISLEMASKEWAQIKQSSFKKACSDVLGEYDDDWYSD